jgi:hypothetical protein
MTTEKMLKEKKETTVERKVFKPAHEKNYNSPEEARQALNLIKSKKKSGELPKWAKAIVDGNKVIFNFSPKKYGNLLK